LKISLGQDERAKRRFALLPMTPMIDVVFLLLIYFMVTSSMTPSESRLTSALQAENKSGRAADLQPQIITVDLVDGQPAFIMGERLMRTKRELVELLRLLPKEGGVFVKVAGRAPVSATATALQACKDGGFAKVTYVPAN
jgi:biopolymer transport protein ExbD